MTILQEPRWLNEIRSSASEKFFSLKIPEEREEAWRYTDLQQLGVTNNSFVATDSEIRLDGEDKEIIFTDLLNAVRTHPELIRNHLGKAFSSKDKIASFHYANLMNGVLVFVPANKKAKLSTKISGNSHTIIITGENSHLEYTEELAGSGFGTDAMEIFAGEDSKIDLLSIQKCDKDAKRFSFKDAKLSSNASINLFVSSSGAALHRSDVNLFMEGEGARAETICGLKSTDSQHSDFMIKSHHIAQNTYNNIVSRSIVDGKASSVFRGIIKIDKTAQKTDSFLEDHALLLSDEAVANNIPSLEIDANDVKAKHGATVGQIDEEQLFYLMARGLSREESEQLIVSGFLESLVTKIHNKEMADKFRQSLAD